MTRWLPILLLFLPATAEAADRTFAIGSFERVRVEGPFEVRIATGASPGAHASGDQATIDRIQILVNGDTLVVRMSGSGWGERPVTASATAPVVVLSTPRLAGVAILAGAEVKAGRMRADRVDLTVTGAGSLTVEGADTDQLVATVIGTGTMALAGRAATARLVVNGPGAIAAPALTADALIARVEGTGTIETTARYTAQVTTSGLGKVTVLGRPKCQVKAIAGGPVVCGAAS